MNRGGGVALGVSLHRSNSSVFISVIPVSQREQALVQYTEAGVFHKAILLPTEH